MTSRAVTQKYDFLASAYDWIYRGYIRKTNRLAVEAVSLQGNEHILDIGCGTGELEKLLFQQYPNLHSVGIDISKDMLKRGQEKLASYPQAIFKEGDFLKVELPENSFDIGFSVSNFHYFSEPKAVFEKSYHLLKKTGRFILIDWNRDSFQGTLYSRCMPLFDPSFKKVYTIQEMTELFQKTGFRVEKVDFFHVDLRWRMMRLVAKKI